MPATRPDPTLRASFHDPRGADRALQVSWHLEHVVEAGAPDGVVVLSLWRANVCTGSFRLDVADVPDLVRVLSDGMGAAIARRADGSTTGAEPPPHAAAAG